MSFRYFALMFVAGFLFLSISYLALAQEKKPSLPLDLQLSLDRQSLNIDEHIQATLLLRNTSPYTLTRVMVRLQGTALQITDSRTDPDTIGPFSGTQVEYGLQSLTTGSPNVTFVVEYRWIEPTVGPRQWIETATVEEIEVTPTPRFTFDWPDYLIPLVIGILTGQLVTVWNERRKQKQAAQEREEQAKGVMLAILQTVREGVKRREQVSFDLWEEAVLKANLYPALHRWGQRVGKSDIPERLAKLSVTLVEYNIRQEKGSLTEEWVAKLDKNLSDLIGDVVNN